jgi:hypothetical protein
MKDEEVKLEEIEVSHTLGGYRSVGVTLMSYTLKYVSLTDLDRLLSSWWEQLRVDLLVGATKNFRTK